MELGSDDRKLLLALARRSVEAATQGGKEPPLPDDVSYELECGFGAFVTLKDASGRLRGCIGTLVAHGPLIETVREMARSAAQRDSRFPPVRAEEVISLRIEISVLSALEEITPEEVVIGRHGLFVRSGAYSGVLLPQVATEHTLTRQEFIEETCHKAGLPRDAWRDPATVLYGFTACVFGEDA